MSDKNVPCIELRHVKKYFKTPKGDLHAVDDINVRIKKGTTLGVVGESGCGKSTLGRVALKLLPSTSGNILFNGTDITNYSEREMIPLRKDMQLIFQDPYSSLNPRQSISEIVAEPLKIYRSCKDKSSLYERVEELLDTVGLAKMYANSYPHELDGGRRQRAGIARAIAMNPDFIVCDEPVSALDVSIQAQILNLLMDLQDSQQLTYMFITHDLSVVKHISTDIMVMYLGQCVEIASSRELFKNPAHPYTKALLAAVPVPSLNGKNLFQSIITGELTSPIEPPKGCRFVERCPYASDKCRGRDIPLREIAPGHHVACTLHET